MSSEKGQGQALDWIVAISIFLSIIAIAFTYTESFHFTRIQGGRTLKAATFGIYRDITAEASEEVYRVPIRSSESPYPLELDYNFSAEVDNESITAGKPTDFAGGDTLFLTNGTWEEFYYTEKTNLSKNWTTNLSLDGYNFSNLVLNLSFGPEGDLNKIKTRYLTQRNLSTPDQACNAQREAVYGELDCNGKLWRIYYNSTLFRFYGDWIRFNASRSSFEGENTSGSIDYSSNEVLYDNSTGFFSVHDSSVGISFYGDMDVFLSDNGTCEVVNQGEKILLHPYQGSGDERRKYENYSVDVGSRIQEEIMLWRNLQQLENKTYDSLKEDITVGVDFNVKIERDGEKLIELGKEIPMDRDVVVQQMEDLLMKDGKVFPVKLLLGVWT